MNTELAKKLMCIKMRDGVELWLEDDRIQNLKSVLKQLTGAKFIEIGEQLINSADITGIYEPSTIEDMTRKKQGQWQDKRGEWHDKNEVVPDMSASRRELDKLYKNNPVREI
jgi:hypothetical protein